MARKLLDLLAQTDLRALLPAISCPTLVLHRTDDSLIPVEAGREVAQLIPGARLMAVPGTDNYGFDPDQEALGLVEEFLTGERHLQDSDRVLATVMFTDICDSTAALAARGDLSWQRLLDEHDRIAAHEIARHRGQLVKSTGDGVLATFDGRARAVRCAQALQAGWDALGLPTRIGLHTGECQRSDSDVRGLAVHLAARVCDLAAAGSILTTGTVKDLVIGAGLQFTPFGEHSVRGVPGSWQLYVVDDPTLADGTLPRGEPSIRA